MLNEKMLSDIKEEALKNHIPILEDDSLDLICMILALVKPNKILEIGSAIGYSAINFSKYLTGENAVIKTIERDTDMIKKARENICNMELDKKIELIEADATVYLKNLKEDNTYDVIFIDAAKGQYVVFLKEAIRLIKSGGVIIADNVFFRGRVFSNYNEHKYRTATNRIREYLKIIADDDRLDSRVINVGDGVAVSIVSK